jgi:hypothetical protein
MSDHLISQALLAWEHFLSGTGFGEPARAAAQKRGWLDQDGRPTAEGRRLIEALIEQKEQRSVFRNLI